jgi:lysyl-tRNA synthetase class 2
MSDEEEHRLVRERRAKVARWRAEGRQPYPWAFPGRVPTSDVVAACRGLAAGAGNPEVRLRVAGRLLAVRSHGKSAFLDLTDLAGTLQLFARVDELEETGFKRWLADLDPGDILGADGTPMVTRRGEPSLLVEELTLLAKAILPPPEKFHGLADVETRIRQRYVDLLASETSRARFVARALLTRETRRFLDDRGFLEFETGVLVPTASGAAAEPFRTQSNWLDQSLQLRIALELPLKRLLVGGLERVYEIGHVFRNEDMDTVHSPEFTMLEVYWAYTDYQDMLQLVEGLYARLARGAAELLPEEPAAATAPSVFTAPFARVDFVQALEQRSGISGLLTRSREELRKLARVAGATVPDDSSTGKFLDKLFDHYVVPTLERPTFVMDHPASTTPLAKRHREKAGRVERFELYYRGVELANAYTELNDPDEQEARFREQLGGKGDDVYALDTDFLTALRYGMPPASGLGIGVDRMMMSLLGATTIKDVILFPPTRSKDGPASEPGAGL